MVVSTSRHASQVGIDILQKRGNAVDAAAAVGFALAVTSSSNGNIGGGGFMVARFAKGKTFTLDYREMAPAAAHQDMYLDKNGNVIEGKSLYTYFASGVPGSVDGLLKAWQDHGSGNISLQQLLDPAIDLAESGFDLSHYEATRFNLNKERLSQHSETKRIFTRDDRAWKFGDVFVQKDLANTLKRIAETGRDGFYKGKTADLIVAEMETVGGWITHEDLENYESKYREPIRGKFNDYDIISMGPPSSGGILLVHMLNMLNEIQKRSTELNLDMSFNSSDYIHVLTEIERRAYADRAEHLGDSDFWDIPRDMLLSSSYAKQRIVNVDFKKASESKAVFYGNSPKESEETTHYSVVDRWGNAFSGTPSDGIGGGPTVPGLGFVMSPRGSQSWIEEDHPACLAAGKRPRLTPTPAMAFRNGRLWMPFGTPGGDVQCQSMVQLFLNVSEFGMNVQQAIEAPRISTWNFPNSFWPHASQPAVAVVESRVEQEVRRNLAGRGHRVQDNEAWSNEMSRVCAITVDQKTGMRTGGADPRGPAYAIGW